MIAQAGAIPYRVQDGKLQVLLITSHDGRRWIFPKGIVDAGETPRQTAAKETFEEAGVRGSVEAAPVGSYCYRKWGTELEVQIYLLHVSEILEKWPEMAVRERVWLSPPQAARRLASEELRTILTRAVAGLSQ